MNIFILPTNSHCVLWIINDGNFYDYVPKISHISDCHNSPTFIMSVKRGCRNS